MAIGPRAFRYRYADAVWAAPALKPNEKLVALVYARFVDVDEDATNDVAWVTWRRLSELTGIRSKDALNRALVGLRNAGWLDQLEGPKQHNAPLYRLTIPDNPEVRETYSWDDGAEVRETDPWPEVRETDPSEVRDTDPWGDEFDPSEVRLADNWTGEEPVEKRPGVRENVARGTSRVPNPGSNPAKPPVVNVGAYGTDALAREIPGQSDVYEQIAEIAPELSLVTELRLADPPNNDPTGLDLLMGRAPCQNPAHSPRRHHGSWVCPDCVKARSA